MDGNKRTALHSMLAFLLINDCQVVATDDELETFIIGIASSNLNPPDIVQWLKIHTANINFA
ncbi:type II toxin-antitoxin system death-on-curing family toxin [Veillonella sp. YH-vei2232]|uniref:type II toxin-antitoxin system death-on-curing family toxin n=1 Tax=Veillonella absiana TaxID=3079305 RepID=UPI00293FCD49|nr:type II toxin-antitoxin system death-on-curing family toxin [Veillonella sp. YH-vei2232]MDV5063400.1 type II toxin-antitoxin system death-on-curing family toxin [Veillonella sp. YH-vei2232]